MAADNPPSIGNWWTQENGGWKSWILDPCNRRLLGGWNLLSPVKLAYGAFLFGSRAWPAASFSGARWITLGRKTTQRGTAESAQGCSRRWCGTAKCKPPWTVCKGKPVDPFTCIWATKGTRHKNQKENSKGEVTGIHNEKVPIKPRKCRARLFSTSPLLHT